MLDETFYLDGVNALSVGVRLQSPVTFSGLVPIVEQVPVVGRNGKLTFDTGAFENRKGKAECYAIDTQGEDVSRYVSAASSFLLNNAGYRRLECSNDPEHFWLARVANGAQIEDRIKRLNPFAVEFDCMPQKFEKSGEYNVLLNAPATLYNGFSGTALPFVIVHGNGAGTLKIGGYNCIINDMTNTLYIDSELGEVYNEEKLNQSGKVLIREYPRLAPGENQISWSGGVTDIIIKPRWWSK